MLRWSTSVLCLAYRCECVFYSGHLTEILRSLSSTFSAKALLREAAGAGKEGFQQINRVQRHKGDGAKSTEAPKPADGGRPLGASASTASAVGGAGLEDLLRKRASKSSRDTGSSLQRILGTQRTLRRVGPAVFAGHAQKN